MRYRGLLSSGSVHVEARTGIVIENTESLAEICGANDYNLGVISRILDARVLSRGNELLIDSSDHEICALFISIIEALSRAIADGLPATPDLILAINADLTPEGSLRDKQEFLDLCIQVPGGFSKVYPRSRTQSLYLKGLATHDVTFAIGPAGTGKTYLAIAWALRELLTKTRRKLVLTRPVVEAGESLGFLPGDLVQKISPYLRPLYDSMEAIVPYDTIRRLEETRAIEIAPLAYMRGRNLANCVVILDEAQNTTKEQMKMFLTRLGENSRAIITGDATQTDLPRRMDSGLVHATGILRDVEGIFVCNLDSRDVVRSPLVRRIVEAYESA